MFSFVTKATSQIDPSTPSTTKPNPTRFTVSHAQLSIIVTLKCIERIRILLAAKIREDSRFISMDRAETDAQRNGFPAEEKMLEKLLCWFLQRRQEFHGHSSAERTRQSPNHL